MTGEPMKRYRALVGLTYPDGAANVELARKGKLDKVTKWKRVEPGEIVSDIPAASIPWLLADGKIELVEGGE